MLSLARLLMLLGLVLIITGGMLYIAAKSGFRLGEMPGNLQVQLGNVSCIFALGASIILSLLLTIVLNVVIRLMNR